MKKPGNSLMQYLVDVTPSSERRFLYEGEQNLLKMVGTEQNPQLVVRKGGWYTGEYLDHIYADVTDQ